MTNFKNFNVALFDEILGAGLSCGLGKRGRRVCIEAALCQVLGLPHGDSPDCVNDTVRDFAITLNDAGWSSTKSRAKGLRALGLAQLGTLDLDLDGDVGSEFNRILAEKLQSRFIPVLRSKMSACEPTLSGYPSHVAIRQAITFAGNGSNMGGGDRDQLLTLIADLAVETLRELKSPGVKLLNAIAKDKREERKAKKTAAQAAAKWGWADKPKLKSKQSAVAV